MRIKNLFGFLIMVLWLAGSANTHAQSDSYFLQLKDTSAYNPVTNTIDLYATILVNDEVPEQLDYGELSAWESISAGDTLPLNILSISREQDAISGDRQYVKILTRSDVALHRKPRRYILRWTVNEEVKAEDSITTIYSDANAFNLIGSSNVPLIMVVGFLILSILLLGLSESVPLIRKRAFHSKYVRQLFDVLPAGETKLHPVTGRPIPPNTLVVHRCSREECDVPLALWKENGYRCYHAPRLCTGSANLGFQRFFEQAGVFRSLNWLWFGAVGGFLGWFLSFLGKEAFLANPYAQSWSVALITGTGLGLGLAFMLALVEELGSARGFDWPTLLLRSWLGTVAGGIVFVGGFYLEHGLESPLTGTIITWFVFTLSLGAVLSVQSFISLKRALLSSLIAGAASTLIYGLMIYLFEEAEMARMLSFILLGAILGWGILQVVTRLEQMELMVVSPSMFNENVYNVDRMVANGRKAMIGRIKGKSDIYIKWDDKHARDRHAELFLNNNKLFIQPLKAAEIWVNQRPVTGAFALNSGDVIKLGRDSLTTLMFKAKVAESVE